MWGIEIGVFEAAESIPAMSFTPKCKVCDFSRPHPFLLDAQG